MWDVRGRAIPRLFFFVMLTQTLVPRFADQTELENTLVSKSVFLELLREALAEQRGFAVGKIGVTEQQLLVWLMLQQQNAQSAKKNLLALVLKNQARSHSGIFPAENDFYLRFGQAYVGALHQLDVIGLFRAKQAAFELMLLNHFQFANPLTRFQNLHPDHSIPDDASNCYLPLLRDKKILIVTPFGNLLASRATREIFEGVWRASGKKFFEPARVEGLEFPYGFARETWTRYATCLDLMDEIQNEMARRDFDVALIGAGGMGVPLAAFVKRLGKIGIMLGGHLQLIFGVKGARWKNDRTWRDTFFNEWWIDMPAHYHPKQGDDAGEYAYW